MIDEINQLPAPLFLPKGHYCSQHQSVCLLLSRTASQFPDVFLDCQQLGQACVELEQTELGVNAYKRFFLHVSQVLFFLTVSFLADYYIFLLPVLYIYIYILHRKASRAISRLIFYNSCHVRLKVLMPVEKDRIWRI